jgi:hypothetical protein
VTIEAHRRAVELCVDSTLNFGKTVTVLRAEGHEATVSEVEKLWLRQMNAREARRRQENAA